MNLRTWRPENPVITGPLTGLAAGLATFLVARNAAPQEALGTGVAAGVLAFVAHDRWVDAMWPFNLPPFSRIPNRRLAGPTYT